MIQAVFGFLVLLIGAYAQIFGQLLLQVLLNGLFELVFRRKKTRKTSLVARRPDYLEAGHPQVDESEIKVSSVVGAMDGRLVQLEIAFGEAFQRHQTVTAWVKKPRAGERLPTVRFVISPPDGDYGAETHLIQVPDEQLGDFEKVEGRKNVYRLTSVLYVEDVVSEEMVYE